MLRCCSFETTSKYYSIVTSFLSLLTPLPHLYCHNSCYSKALINPVIPYNVKVIILEGQYMKK